MSEEYPNQSYHGMSNQVYPNQEFAFTFQPQSEQTNTVVIQQQQCEVKAKRDWSTGVFSCCEDMGVCCLMTLFGQCYVCFLANKMGESCWVPCCVPLPTVPMRAAFREKHNIRGSICDDCVCVTFCAACVVCQLAREMKVTGDL